MGSPGRPRKPNALKLLDGNVGKRPFDDEFAPAASLDVPAMIADDPIAADAFVSLATELRKLGLFTVLDVDGVTAFAVYKSRWIVAMAEVKAKGLMIMGAKGNLYRNPMLDVEAQALAAMERMMDKFGLTPSARSRLKGKGTGVDASGRGLLDQTTASEPLDVDIKNWEPPKNGTVG